MEIENNLDSELIKIKRVRSESNKKTVPLTLNVKKLISIIKEHPIIYQTTHDMYRDSNGRNTIWEEISLQMDCPEKICKAKWRACRDQYARELKRFGNNMSCSRWKYTRDLEFLRPYTLKRVYKQRMSYYPLKDHEDDSLVKEGVSLDSSGLSLGSEVSGEMQFEKSLISEIREHEYLYNTHHPDYRKFENKKIIWESIGFKINKTESQCRLKWKALRDQFSREAKRVIYCDDPESTPKWKHYEDLKFLEKHIKLSDSEKKSNSMKKSKVKDEDKTVIIRKSRKRKQIKEEVGDNVDSPDLSCVYDEVNPIDPEDGEYTFEIIKSKEEAIDVVNEEIFDNETEYVDVYQNENIISKEHSYQSNEIIEFINFAEDADLEEAPDEGYPLNDEDIIASIEENDDESNANVDNNVEDMIAMPERQSFCEEEKQSNKSITEDLEVDSFFKTLAMKVKNAKLSQSLFTDLQIELLQTIQNKLKNS
ncbi:hypothetical protein ACFFRR_000611 [Megaselia abdita]